MILEGKKINGGDKITVHIADDHQIIIDGLQAVLEQEDDLKIVGHSLNGEEVLTWLQNNQTDILLLDINMPHMAGIEVLEQFQSLIRKPKVIILSSHDDIKLIKDAIRLGAKGFVPKKSNGEHIVDAIRSVYNGEQYYTEDIKEKMIRTLTGIPKHDENTPEGMLMNSLTRREYQVLKLIAQEYTTKEMADSLFVSDSTIETHRKNLYKKINVKNSVGLGLFAIKNKII